MIRNFELFGTCVPHQFPIRQTATNHHSQFTQFRPYQLSRFRNRTRCVPEGEITTSNQSTRANDQVVTQSVPLVAVKERESLPVVVHVRQTGWFGSIVLVFFLAVTTTSAALTAFMIYIRPVLKTFEETCKSAEKASKQLEVTAIELEEAAIMFDEQLPPALKSVEAAGREFEELGQNLNSLSGGLLSRRPSRHRRRGNDQDAKTKMRDEKEPSGDSTNEIATLVPKEQCKKSSGNITKRTMDSIQKVASDINNLTQGLGPAMDMWRRKLTSIVSTVEAEQKANGDRQLADTDTSSIKELPPPASTLERSNSKDSSDEEVKSSNISTTSVMDGVSIELERIDRMNNGDDQNDYTEFVGIDDLFKDKDSLVARLAHESTTDAAELIMDALYKAEQAAEEAANASGELQEAVERVRNSGAWDVSDGSE